MGVLEDAIREHLDLKRKHGASDEELTRQEAEALGPTRREMPEPVDEPAHTDVIEPEPPEAAPASANEDTVLYAPEDAAVHRVEERDEGPGENPDFGTEQSERKPPRDFDFD